MRVCVNVCTSLILMAGILTYTMYLVLLMVKSPVSGCVVETSQGVKLPCITYNPTIPHHTMHKRVPAPEPSHAVVLSYDAHSPRGAKRN